MQLSFKTISAEDHIDDQIRDFIAVHDNDFYPPISSRTDLDEFVQSVYKFNGKYFICYHEDRIIALMSVYLTDPSFIYYYNYIAIDKSFRKQGISATLLKMGDDICRKSGAQRAMGKTWSTNNASKALFKKHGFFHVYTKEDHRSKGVHSFFYTKSFSDVQFREPVNRLGILTGNNYYALGNFIKTISSIPKTTTKEYSPLPFVAINDALPSIEAEGIDSGKAFEKVNDTIALLEKNDVSHILFLDSYNYPAIDLSKTNIKAEIIDLSTIIKSMVNERKKKCLLVAIDNKLSQAFFDVNDVCIPLPYEANRIQEIVANIKNGDVPPSYYKEDIVAIAAANDCEAILLGSAELHTMFGLDKIFNGIELFDPWMEIAIIMQNNSTKFKNHFIPNDTSYLIKYDL